MCAATGATGTTVLESDMVVNYRGIAVLWLALCVFCATGSARAETVRAGELELDVAAPWRHLTTDVDGLDRNIVLRQTGLGATIEVYLAKHPVRLQTTPENFYGQLERGWRAHYGEQVELGWQEIAGVRWRWCRHPGRNNDSTIFQLVTVRAEEAYQILVVAPEGSAELPDRVLALLLQSHWRGEPHTASATSWHLLRSVVVLPDQNQWAQIAGEEAPHLGVDGRVTGIGLQSLGNGLDWFIEGSYLDESNAAQRNEYRVHWQLAWQPLPEAWRADENLAMNLAFSGSPAQGAGFGVRYELHEACTTREAFSAWLDELTHAGDAAMARIGELEQECPATAADPAPALPVVMVEGGSDTVVARKADVPLPKDWAEAPQPSAAGSERHLLLIMRPMVSGSGTASGDALLGRAAVVFVFGPDS